MPAVEEGWASCGVDLVALVAEFVCGVSISAFCLGPLGEESIPFRIRLPTESIPLAVSQ